ncbi:hypothetical protein BST97_11345 [Nonlabens spongiae]|uniref:Uncharacterized protein n=1 Tax=Nonlabens spongiae TaxID=331648 RepID=A0A1W6MLT2_9FLAO|nr:hypothetical protein [Nonlabens spongiae]ARN78532.1 hypothetical protein BST97_11345 [Nonlabens spongiae]
MKNSTKRKIGELLFQIIPVMIGVFLGFLVSSWAESSRNEEKTELFVQNLIAEVETNKSRLDNVYDYHIMLRDSVQSYVARSYEADSSKTPRKPKFFKGIRMFPLMDSAYETGTQTGLINGLSLPQIQQINQVYTLQKFYNGYHDNMMTGFMNQDPLQDIDRVVRFLAISMTDVVLREQELRGQYDQLLKELQKELN